MTVFDATSTARTFDYRGWGCRFCAQNAGAIENIGSTTVRLLNVFNNPRFEDISLNQWMELTPPELVRG